ncbi:poxB regulator PoxA [Catenovulum agarivorans DS-2]|uniref:PoxB regulator PoxA n=1 Tax=Catenovulum agarivorans DS-2 TaxID=1328313 RepID=W7QMA3_9ALTE|nr:elongation factor P--(R)-beta-lysine ligase [Catenovulum agarivorans]EWH10062.1 poxB regulator PoxA [Catenovulum agarivorans DS-2]
MTTRTNSATHWQPSANIATLKQRARIISQIRQFFANRNVLEVETPSLSQHGVTDLHLDNLTTHYGGAGFAQGVDLYLQTSPEFAMKRLLAAGSGCIFQLAKAFRDDEFGRQHNPEFTMLEWYRVGFSRVDLMNEVAELVKLVLNVPHCKAYTYQQLFIEYLQLDPLACNVKQLTDKLQQLQRTDIVEIADDKTSLLQIMFAEFIEPKMAQDAPCFVYHFPAEQASLARLNQQDQRVAERFELYYRGIELANGFDELTNANEQLERFEQDNQLRMQYGKCAKSIDMRLIAALNAGLPQCSGVALGVDRLIMLALGATGIEEVIAFPLTRC